MTHKEYIQLDLEITKKINDLSKEKEEIKQKFILENSRFKKFDIIYCKSKYGFDSEEIRISTIDVEIWKNNPKLGEEKEEEIVSFIYGGSPVITFDDKKLQYRSGYGYNTWKDIPQMYELKLSKLNKLEFVK